MSIIIKIARLVLRVLGFIEKVRPHTRMGGAVKVIGYWRHV